MPSSRTATVAANLSSFPSFLTPIPPTIPRNYSTLSGNGAANARAKAAGRVRGPPAAPSAPDSLLWDLLSIGFGSELALRGTSFKTCCRGCVQPNWQARLGIADELLFCADFGRNRKPPPSSDWDADDQAGAAQ